MPINKDESGPNQAAPSGTGSTKNPNGEAATPAPMPIDGQKENSWPGQNSQGNDRGDAQQDPEGQQGSTRI
jgi:hypothetical protein